MAGLPLVNLPDGAGSPAQLPVLSIVIPARNEAGNIAALLAALDRELAHVSREYVLVDDSDDDTPQKARDARPQAPLNVCHRGAGERHGGLGGAVTLGMRSARGRWACVMDADLQHPPEAVRRLLEAAQGEAFDLVVASRYVEGGSAAGLSSPVRKFVSRLASRLPRWLLYPRIGAVSDVVSGFFLVRRDAVDWAALRPRGFKILLELMARTPGLRATEIPYTFGERTAGESKASLREGVRFLRQLVSLWLSEPGAGRLWKFLAVGATGLAVNAAAFAAVHRAGASPFLAWIAGVETSVLSNFALNALVTFRDRLVLRRGTQVAAALAGYHAATVVGIAVNAVIFSAGVAATDIDPLAWAMLSATAGALVNYSLAGRIAFRRRPAPWI
ncbi:MAG: glycosyltransferase family 2 protein [Dehalococcoidia bacterium]|nr:glycosyltransferase family 2 protein [Dehalococcoidia bacterium]MCB9486174.1 glycosyltransferase family 2 protein [Thermoflexaceae bacterium]